MKKLNFAFVVLALSAYAFADIAPRPGTVISTQIDSTAAQILFNSLTEEVGNLPADLVSRIRCRRDTLVVDTGKVHTANDGRITIACSTYYCLGRNAICKLKQTY